MIEVSTNRPIRLDQLADEIGSDRLVLRSEGDESVITYWGDDLTVEDLQMAVNDHFPNATETSLSIEERLLAAQEQIAEHQMMIDALVLDLLG